MVATPLDTLRIDVEARISKAEAQLKSIGAQTRRTGQKMKGGFDTADRSARRLRSSISRIGPVIAALGAGVAVRAIVQTNARFQDLQLTLDTVFGSMREGQDAMAFIRDFASRTPFDIETLTRSMIQLQGAGVKPTEELLTTLGDAAAATTNRMQTLEALVRITARSVGGGLGLEEFEQLVNAGLPVYQILQEEIGASRLELTELGKTAEGAGRIMEGLRRGLDRRFGGGMQRASNQLSTALSNLGIEGQNVLLALGEGVGGNDGLTTSTRDLALAMTDLLKSIQPLAKILGSSLALGLNAVSAVLNVISGTIEAIGDGIERLEEIGEGNNSQFANFDTNNEQGVRRLDPATGQPLLSLADQRTTQGFLSGDREQLGDLANLSLTASNPTNPFLANRGARGSQRAAIRENGELTESTSGATKAIVEFADANDEADESLQRLQNSVDTIAGTLSTEIVDIFSRAVSGSKLELDSLADAARSIFKQIAAEAAAAKIGSFFAPNAVGPGSGGGGFLSSIIPGFASGGRVPGNSPILVGEDGPEIYRPPGVGGGTIVPNHQLGGGGMQINVNPTYNISAGVAPTIEAEINRYGARLTNNVVGEIVRALPRGGPLPAAIRRA